MAKKSKEWKIPDEEPLTPAQRISLIVIVSLIPVFFLIILPLIVRNYIVSTLKLPENVIFAIPEEKKLSGGIGLRTYKIRIQGFEFQIPENYVPTLIENDLAEFRVSPRRSSRTITIHASRKSKPVDLQGSGLVRWFLPKDMLEFFDTILFSYWHPVRLLGKANFFVNEGIAGPIFSAKWDANHRGYIFPMQGEKGFLGRIFGQDGTGYAEIGAYDQVKPVTFEEWCDFGVLVKPPFHQESQIAASGPRKVISPRETFVRAKDGGYASQTAALEDSLNEFFQTGHPSWIIPIAHVMEQRGFYGEVINLCGKFSKTKRLDNDQISHLRDAFEKAWRRVLFLENDPDFDLNQITIYCQNLSDFPIRKIQMKLTYGSTEGEKCFRETLFDNSTLYGPSTKTISINPPAGFNIKAPDLRLTLEALEIEN